MPHSLCVCVVGVSADEGSSNHWDGREWHRKPSHSSASISKRFNELFLKWFASSFALAHVSFMQSKPIHANHMARASCVYCTSRSQCMATLLQSIFSTYTGTVGIPLHFQINGMCLWAPICLLDPALASRINRPYTASKFNRITEKQKIFSKDGLSQILFILQYACAQFCLWPNIIFKHCNFAQTLSLSFAHKVICI